MTPLFDLTRHPRVPGDPGPSRSALDRHPHVTVTCTTDGGDLELEAIGPPYEIAQWFADYVDDYPRDEYGTHEVKRKRTGGYSTPLAIYVRRRAVAK